jgi:predicted Zn-dependent peptidase
MDLFLPRRLDDADADALGLVNTMLTETLHSRILGEARERGLVYGMSSNYLQTKCATNWWFGSQVTAENAPALFAIIAKELQSVRDGEITAADISAAQQYMLGSVSSAVVRLWAVQHRATRAGISSKKSSMITLLSQSVSRLSRASESSKL